jgi:predicted phage gp36 major capsid-like protein
MEENMQNLKDKMKKIKNTQASKLMEMEEDMRNLKEKISKVKDTEVHHEIENLGSEKQKV